MDGSATVKLLPAEQARPGEQEYLDDLMAGPVAEPDPDAIEAIEASPFDPSLALSRNECDRLCDPDPLEVESGWTVLPDLSVQIAVSTPMPDLTPEMVEWWFDWHPRRGERYRVWHPLAHFDNGVGQSSGGGKKPSWGATNQVAEDIGDGRQEIRIDFQSPREFGFADDYLDDPVVGTIICARAGDSRVSHTDMAHVFLREGEGLRLRSRFWIGENIRPRLPGPLAIAAGPFESLVSRRQVRKLAIPDRIGPGLARHCAEEYANLNQILPGLFDRFSH